MIFKRKLPIPQEVKEEFPLSDHLAAIKAKNDEESLEMFEFRAFSRIIMILPSEMS